MIRAPPRLSRNQLIGFGTVASPAEEGSVTITAAQAMAASQKKEVGPALEEAKQFLTGLIGCDGTPVKEIEKEAKSACIPWATIRRAKDELKLKSIKVGFEGWAWKLPYTL